MPTFCPKCGAQNSDWAQTCQQCSAPLPSRASGDVYGGPFYGQQPAPPGYQPAPYQQPQAPAYGASPYGAHQQPAYGYGAFPAANYAGMGKRIAAYFLDGIVGFVGALPGFILLFFGIIMAGASGREPEVGLILLSYPVLFAGLLAVWLYNIYLLGRDGATLGKRWMGIKVLDGMGQPLGFGKAFLREIVKGALANVCFILLLWPLWDQEKQGLYDKIFGTHVFEA